MQQIFNCQAFHAKMRASLIFLRHIQTRTLPETVPASLALKNGGWEMQIPFGFRPLFRGFLLLVLGRVCGGNGF